MKKRHLIVAMLLVSMILTLVSCDAKEKTPEYELQEQKEYVRPETRMLVEDQELLSRLREDIPSKYLYDDITELKSPILVIIQDKIENEVDYGITDRFETTTNPEEANSVLIIKSDWMGFHFSSNATVEEYCPTYYYQVMDQDLQVTSRWFEMNLTYREYGTLSYQPHSFKEIDEEAFDLIAKKIRISAESNNAYIDKLLFWNDYSEDEDLAILKAAIDAYSYPESDNLEGQMERIDTDKPCFLFDAMSKEKLRALDEGTVYSSSDTFANIVDANCAVVTLDAWSKAHNGETGRYLALLEYTELYDMGTYYGQVVDGQMQVYGCTYRVTVVDSQTSEVVGWLTTTFGGEDLETVSTGSLEKINDKRVYHPSAWNQYNALFELFGYKDFEEVIGSTTW